VTGCGGGHTWFGSIGEGGRRVRTIRAVPDAAGGTASSRDLGREERGDQGNSRMPFTEDSRGKCGDAERRRTRDGAAGLHVVEVVSSIVGICCSSARTGMGRPASTRGGVNRPGRSLNNLRKLHYEAGQGRLVRSVGRPPSSDRLMAQSTVNRKSSASSDRDPQDLVPCRATCSPFSAGPSSLLSSGETNFGPRGREPPRNKPRSGKKASRHSSIRHRSSRREHELSKDRLDQESRFCAGLTRQGRS